jgi:hypothetical protein
MSGSSSTRRIGEEDEREEVFGKAYPPVGGTGVPSFVRRMIVRMG